MNRKTLIALSFTAAFAGGGYAVAQQPAHTMPGGHGGMDHGGMDPAMMKMMTDMLPTANDTPAVRGYKEAHMKMMRNMHITLSGKPDVDFMRGMIPHHQGAIEMAKVQLEHGTDAQARKLAETIIQDQEREIGQMRAWLKAKGVE